MAHTTALAASAMHDLRETVSLAGKRIRLTRDCGTYEGARPYFTVAYDLRDDPRPGRQPSSRVIRYTPFLGRAEFLYERFRADITDPAELAR